MLFVILSTVTNIKKEIKKNGSEMNPEDNHIIVSYLEDVPDEYIKAFQAELSAENLLIHYDSRVNKPYMGVEEYLPTVITVFILQSYIKSFLSEMGKDHYKAFKNASSKIWQQISQAFKQVATSPNKVGSKYSFCFSIFTSYENTTIKLLFGKNLDLDTFKERFLIALETIADIHDGKQEDLNYLISKYKGTVIISGKVLLAYSEEDDCFKMTSGLPLKIFKMKVDEEDLHLFLLPE